MLTIREYKKAESLEEAYTLNQKKSNRVIGGMIWLKMETLNVGTAIDLSGLGLDTIEETDTEFRIGAMASLRALELHEGLAAYTNGAMRESVRHIVGVQLRNLATVGGSLYSRFGFSDVLTMFLVLDARVELYKGGIVPLFRVRRKTQGPRYSGARDRSQAKGEVQLPVCAHQPDRYSGADLCVRQGRKRLPVRHRCPSSTRTDLCTACG